MEFSGWCAKDGIFLDLVMYHTTWWSPACFAMMKDSAGLSRPPSVPFQENVNLTAKRDWLGLSEKSNCKIFPQIVVKDFHWKSTFDWIKIIREILLSIHYLASANFHLSAPSRKIWSRAETGHQQNQPIEVCCEIYLVRREKCFCNLQCKLLSFHTFEEKSQALRTAYQQNQLTKSS